MQLSPANRLEGIPEVFDRWRSLTVGPDDGDDIEPASLLQEPMSFEKMERGQGQSALLFRGDGFARVAFPTRFDLDEDQHIAISGDQVNFPFVRPVASGEDAKSGSTKETGGLAFSSVAEPTVPEGSDNRIHRKVASMRG
jgi:hypothetical protein